MARMLLAPSLSALLGQLLTRPFYFPKVLEIYVLYDLKEK